MKVAFTSCMSTTVFKDQPVWDDIRAMQPNHLVLTGDSIYIDAPPFPVHPKEMSDDAFVQHVFTRYRALLAQPQFAALVQAVPTEAIWDDHDFLWNESFEEKAITKKIYAGMVRGSRALFNAYARALSSQLAPGVPDSFPVVYNDARLWQDNEPAPGYRFRDLGQGVALHLTDGRSYRLRNALLGQAQRQQMAAKFDELPADTVHLLASGSVVEAHKGDHWGQFEDYQWLLEEARHHNILVLSGDIHANHFGSIALGDGRFLFEATASGAAIRRLVTLLSRCQNHGLLQIDANEVAVSLFEFNLPEAGMPRRIDRQRWQPIA